MAKEFRGLKKEEHEKLTRAAAMYTNMTGEKIDVASIPVYSEEEDAKAKQKQAENDLKRTAETTRKVEEARQEERRLKIQAEGGVQDHNPGPGQPAMITERAKAQGKSRKGQEPGNLASGGNGDADGKSDESKKSDEQ